MTRGKGLFYKPSGRRLHVGSFVRLSREVTRKLGETARNMRLTKIDDSCGVVEMQIAGTKRKIVVLAEDVDMHWMAVKHDYDLKVEKKYGPRGANDAADYATAGDWA